MGRSKPQTLFLRDFNSRTTTLARNIGRLEDIQKKDPSFNYQDNEELKFHIDMLEKQVKELKQFGVKNLEPDPQQAGNN